MTSLFVSLSVFCLVGAAAVAIYVGLYGSHRVLEERFADLAVKIRASQGVFDDDGPDDNFGRVLFKWAAARVPAPDLDSPTGEKLQQTLLQAGYIGSSTPHTYQVFRVLFMIACALIGVFASILLGKPQISVMTFGILGALLGYLLPMMYIQRRARNRQMAIARQLSDVLDLLVVCVEAGLGLFEAIRIVGTES